MLRWWRTALRGRPWIAVAVGYAIAMQALLAGISGTRMAASADFAGDIFVICHSNGEQDDGSGKASIDHASCALCTLASVAQAILPVDHAITPIDTIIVAAVFASTPSNAADYDSFSAHSARGPPITAAFVG